MSNETTCKDCKHSFRSFWHVLAHGYNSKYNRFCKLSYENPSVEIDPVVGQIKKPGGYQMCASFRIREKDCGPNAKFWEPKDKKNLFKYIKHVSS